MVIMNFNQMWNKNEYENMTFYYTYKLKKCKIQGRQQTDGKEEAI
jgi:hypothetical protein